MRCWIGGLIGHVLIGVVSLGFRCGEPNFPGIYSNVTHYTDWIISKMGDTTSNPKGTYLYNINFWQNGL
jgi:secreted trypsin-like serine protease